MLFVKVCKSVYLPQLRNSIRQTHTEIKFYSHCCWFAFTIFIHNFVNVTCNITCCLKSFSDDGKYNKFNAVFFGMIGIHMGCCHHCSLHRRCKNYLPVDAVYSRLMMFTLHYTNLMQFRIHERHVCVDSVFFRRMRTVLI